MQGLPWWLGHHEELWQNVVFKLKSLKLDFDSMQTEFPDVQAGFKKVEEPEIKPEIQILIES